MRNRELAAVDTSTLCQQIRAKRLYRLYCHRNKIASGSVILQCNEVNEMAAVHGFDALLRAVERGFVPARSARAICSDFRNCLRFLHLQQQQDACTKRFWKRAPEQQLLVCIASAALEASQVNDAASIIVLERDLERVVAAMDDRGLLAPAGDVAAIQALFDRAVIGAVTALRSAHCLLTRYPAIDPAAHNNAAFAACGRRGDAALMQVLLADARVDPGTPRFNEALRAACCDGHADVVRLMLAGARADPKSVDNGLIGDASSWGKTEIVRLLLADGRADPAARSNFAIRIASRFGYGHIVRMLLADSRVDPTADDNRAIRWACSFGQPAVVRLLLADARVDPTAANNEALEQASCNRNADVVKLLLADGRAKVNQSWSRWLTCMARSLNPRRATSG